MSDINITDNYGQSQGLLSPIVLSYSQSLTVCLKFIVNLSNMVQYMNTITVISVIVEFVIILVVVFNLKVNYNYMI